MAVMLPQVRAHRWCHSVWHFRRCLPIAESSLLRLREVPTVFEIVNVGEPLRAGAEAPC